MLKLFLVAGLAFGQSQAIKIDCGSPTDRFFVGGTAFQDAALGDPPLNTLRFGQRFSYRVPAPSGWYLVRILLVEPNASSAGRRLFRITVNGQDSEPLDIFALVANANKTMSGTKATGWWVETTAVSYFGFIKIDFTGIVGNAVVSAIEIYPPVTFTQVN